MYVRVYVYVAVFARENVFAQVAFPLLSCYTWVTKRTVRIIWEFTYSHGAPSYEFVLRGSNNGRHENTLYHGGKMPLRNSCGGFKRFNLQFLRIGFWISGRASWIEGAYTLEVYSLGAYCF